MRDRLRNGLEPVPDAPVFEGDYADPFVLAVGPTFYLYTTNTRDANVPVLRSVGAVVGQQLGDALPELPEWSEPGLVWAPSVLRREGGYVLYYTTVHNPSGRMCISVATSGSPEGPFADDSSQPLVCQLELGGSIDPSPFVDDDGSTWLTWKSDGNCCDIPTRIWSQRLSDDGLRLEGSPVELLTTSEDWEGPLVEAPSMFGHDDSYWLLYSANRWDTADYAVGIARCESPSGPCTKVGDRWLDGHGSATGPGGAEAFVHPRGDQWVVYHAWVTDAVGYDDGGARSLFLQPLDYSEGAPLPGGLSGE